MSDTTGSVQLLGRLLADVQKEQRRQGERIEFLADQLAELRGVVVTRDLAERLMIRAGERFAGLEARLDQISAQLASIAGKLPGPPL